MQHRMTCEQVREGLREYLDAAAPPGGGRTEQHLRDCDACAAFVHELRETSRLLSILPKPPMPAPAKASLLEAFRRLPPA